MTENIRHAISNAIENGDIQKLKIFLQQDPGIANHPDWTPPPLHCAVLWNQPEIAEVLLDHGAKIEMLDPDQQTTPLRYAIMYCKADLIPLLLSRGANSGAIVDGGTSALQLAMEAAGGKYEVFDDLPRRQAYDNIIEILKRSEPTE